MAPWKLSSAKAVTMQSPLRLMSLLLSSLQAVVAVIQQHTRQL
jgi:hypothetical protein